MACKSCKNSVEDMLKASKIKGLAVEWYLLKLNERHEKNKNNCMPIRQKEVS